MDLQIICNISRLLYKVRLFGMGRQQLDSWIRSISFLGTRFDLREDVLLTLRLPERW